jgi:hypothetical protein
MKKIAFLTVLIITLSFAYLYYPEYKLPKETKIDSIVVYKSKRQLLVYSKGNLLKT